MTRFRLSAGVVGFVAVLGMFAAARSVTFAQTDPHVGTWVLNVAKSKYTPGPPRRNRRRYTRQPGKGLRWRPRASGPMASRR